MPNNLLKTLAAALLLCVHGHASALLMSAETFVDVDESPDTSIHQDGPVSSGSVSSRQEIATTPAESSIAANAFGSDAFSFAMNTSGSQVFFSFSRIVVTETVRNDTADLRRYFFTFDLQPARLSLQSTLPLTQTGLTAGVTVLIERDVLSLFGVSANLDRTVDGYVFSTVGEGLASFREIENTETSKIYEMLGGTLTVDLGVLAPGESFGFDFTMFSVLANQISPGPGLDQTGSTGSISWGDPGQIVSAGSGFSSQIEVAVPEPGLLALLFAGALGFRRQLLEHKQQAE